MEKLILKHKQTGVRAKAFTINFVDGCPLVVPNGQLPPRWVETIAGLLEKARQYKRPQPKGRRQRLQAQHTISQPIMAERPLTGPEDWLSKRGLPNATAVMPARAPEFNADVKTPLAQAGVSGGIVAVGFMASASAVSYFFGWSVDAYINSAIVSGLVGIAAFGQQWFGIIKKNRSTLWALEMLLNTDLDGDKQVGDPYKPRSVRVVQGDHEYDLALENESGGLTRQQWGEVAHAVLINCGNVSRDGVYKNCDLSQSLSNLAVKALHESGRAKDNVLNRAGFDFLEIHLPDHAVIHYPYPAQ